MIEFLGIIYIGCAVIVWFLIAFYMFKVVILRKPHVDIWRDTLWNPFNLILMTSKLTREGLKARKKLMVLALIFILMALLPFIIENFMNIEA